MVFFDQNTLAGDWRAQVRYCRENGIALHRDIAFASAVAIAGRSSAHAGGNSRCVHTGLP